MKKYVYLVLAAFLSITLFSCGCSHSKWQEASCQAPKTCVECGHTEGEKSAHIYDNSVCINCLDIAPNAIFLNPLKNFEPREYICEYFSDGVYIYRMIYFGETMASGSAKYTKSPLSSTPEENPKVINGINYYWAGGSAGVEETWSYTLTEKEVYINDGIGVIGRFVINPDGSLRCIYGSTFKVGYIWK